MIMIKNVVLLASYLRN